VTLKSKILVLVGTRPEAIKLAPLVNILKQQDEFTLVLASSGQHGKILKEALEIFNLHPEVDLGALKEGQSLPELGATLLSRIEACLEQTRPDLVVVHGDTSTALFGALAAFYASIPVAHVEAGLRTGKIGEPFPEEFNRKTIGSLASFHFAPTNLARQNLLKEGVTEDRVFVTGNTIVDSVLLAIERHLSEEGWQKQNSLEIKQGIFPGFNEKPYALVTLHRRENAKDGFQGYLKTLQSVALQNPKFDFLFPVHPNPSISLQAKKFLSDMKNVWLCKPLDYLSFLHLLANCSFIVSDSGGIQEEAVTLGKKVLLCRNETERPEAIIAGLVTLIKSDYDLLSSEMKNLIVDAQNHEFRIDSPHAFLDSNPFGSGAAAQLIVKALRENFKPQS